MLPSNDRSGLVAALLAVTLAFGEVLLVVDIDGTNAECLTAFAAHTFIPAWRMAVACYRQ